MSILTIAEVVFFLVFGISTFYPFKYSREISGIAAIIVGILLLVRF